jgi:hypothetical protein
MREVGRRGEAGPTRPDPMRRFKQNLILNFKRFKFGKTWRNSTGRFRRNLDMGIFPKFS